MELVYLSNGQQCYLKETIGSKFIVNRLFEYDDSEMGLIEVEDKDDIVVDQIFKTKPIEKVDAEIKELQLSKSVLSEEVRKLGQDKQQLKNECDTLTRTHISNQKFIINKSELLNAKELVLFKKDYIMPIRMKKEDKNYRGLKLSLHVEIQTYPTEERSWGYALYDDDRYSSGDFLCPKYGIQIDPTEEQIDEIIIKRLAELKFSDYIVARIDDKYLSDELKAVKTKYNAAEITRQIESAKKKIEEGQAALEKLTNQ